MKLYIEYSNKSTEQLNEILNNNSIYNKGHFTQEYINWNREFYHYINKTTISKQELSKSGLFKIGNIGKIEYKIYNLKDAVVFEILEFFFSKLPYQQKKCQYKVVGDAGYEYKIFQSFPSEKYAILSPQRKYLTRFDFDNIIGFHHSIDDYNKVYAVGFIGNRVYAIYPNSHIYSKDEYLRNKHRYDESIRLYKMILSESKINNIIKETLHKYINENRA